MSLFKHAAVVNAKRDLYRRSRLKPFDKGTDGERWFKEWTAKYPLQEHHFFRMLILFDEDNLEFNESAAGLNQWAGVLVVALLCLLIAASAPAYSLIALLALVAIVIGFFIVRNWFRNITFNVGLSGSVSALSGWKAVGGLPVSDKSQQLYMLELTNEITIANVALFCAGVFVMIYAGKFWDKK